MNIYFKTKRLQKSCSNVKEMQKRYGKECADKLSQRLGEIKAFKNLEQLHMLPQARCHALKNNRAGQYAVDLKQPFRLIFIPYNDPVPLKEDGGYDLSKITAVTILEVGDYHGK